MAYHVIRSSCQSQLHRRPNVLCDWWPMAYETVGGVLSRRDFVLSKLEPLLASARSAPPDPERVLSFVLAALPAARHGGITLLRADGVLSPVITVGDFGDLVEQLQRQTSQGPCLEALSGRTAVLVRDVPTDERWPDFAHRCFAETGVRSLLSVRLALADGARAALNIHSEHPRMFDEVDLEVGAVFAPFAAVAVQSAQHAREADHLTIALGSSLTIGVAIGILMARHLITYDQAFMRLRQASNHLNQKIRDIAMQVKETGDLPSQGVTRLAATTKHHQRAGRGQLDIRPSQGASMRAM